ncbi:alpha/beta hydrolase [Kitasatospora mediocidica]|uniref:alpha/beta hydrolase n=1 Tax=Kitasatospora mediocidica TaxID=58352 RepID=UPI00068D2344|nr:alpha/beta hydrolase [Kitasatospora mediocidica]
MISLQQLHDADPQPLADAGTACDTLARSLARHLATVADIHTDAARCWTGAAAAQAQAVLAVQCTQLDAAQTELLTAGALLRDAAAEFLSARTTLLQALADASAAGCTVAADGTVTAPAADPRERHDREVTADRSAAVRSITTRVAQALHDADRADRQAAAQLERLADHAADGSGLDTRTARADAADARTLLAAGLPPASADPVAVSAWWRALTPDLRQLLVQHYPELVGNRDGVPAAARDQANRITLRKYLAAHGDRQSSEAEQAALAGFQAVQDRLDRDAGQWPPDFLYGLSDEGQGRCILSFGDPDTATDVSTYVPGVGTDLAGVGGKDGDRALNIWRAAQQADPSRSTASLVWLGYDPPPGLDRLSPQDPAPAEVLSTDRAVRGARSYQRFTAGLRATHQGPAAHLTAVGHSYGSLTVGLAGQGPGGTGADDVVLIGSPGVDARRAADLGVPADHVWVGAAENDPVSHLPAGERVRADARGAVTGAGLGGPFGAAVGGWLGDTLFARSDGDRLWFGPDPASADFGARRFDVADGPPGFASHSNYLDRSGGNSLRNIGRIVAGRPQDVQTQPPR